MAAQLQPILNSLNPGSKGYKTTEFWIALVSQVIGILVLSGRISPQDQQSANDFFVGIVKLLMDTGTLVYMVYTAYGYIRGRNELKQTLVQFAAAAPDMQVTQVPVTTPSVPTESVPAVS